MGLPLAVARMVLLVGKVGIVGQNDAEGFRKLAEG